MAFKAIPGHTQYEYDDNPPDPGVGNPRRPLWLKSANGIRTEHGQSNYVRCRRIGSGDVDHGEISKSFWDLRSTVSVYAILSLEPKLVFDFKGNYFRKSATDSTFGASITHAATTNATMVDSDGLLKWRPHNLQVHSGDFSNSAWSKSAVTVDTSYVAPDGTSTASKFTSTGAAGATGVYDTNNTGAGKSLTCFMKAGSSGVYGWVEGIVGGASPYAVFDLESGTVVHSRSCDASIEPVGNGWFRCVVANTTISIGFFSVGGSDNTYTSGPWNSSSLTTGKFIYAWGAQLNRSDLGGMVNNPDAPTGLESYVPTTSAPVYLSRRGHHIYNGSAWVNEGILHESEARTNVCTYSNDFDQVAFLRWLPSNITVTPNSAISPDGTTNATKFDMASNGFTRKTTNYVPSVGQTYTFSIWLKAGTVSEVKTAMLFSGGGLGFTSVTHTLTNEWQRFTVTKTVPSGTPDQVRARIIATQAGTIFVYGAQIEEGATQSSYIPTTTASATRAAETLTVPAANLPYDSTNMSIQIDGKMTYADTGVGTSTINNTGEVTFVNWLASSTEFIGSVLNTISSETGYLTVRQRGNTSGIDTVAASSYSPDTNVPFNIASRHGSTFINAAHEGTLLTANTTPTALPNLSSTDLNLGFDFMGTIGQFRMWSDDLTDTGITEATLPSTEPSLSLTFDGSENSFIVLDWSE